MNYVVVVTFNGAAWIRTCLQSIAEHAPSAHAIVIDNASTDETCEIVSTEFPQFQLRRMAVNSGFGVGNNHGVALALQAGARYILLLNQDAYLLPDTMDRMVAFMEEHPEFGICSPLHCSPDERQLDPRTFRNYVVRGPAQQFLMDSISGEAREHYQIHGVNAAVWFVRAETFARVGGFDPVFFMYGEDDDLLQRLKYHGLAFALLTQVRAVHQRQSPKASVPGFVERVRRNARRREAKLLTLIKQPQNSLSFMVITLVSRGLIEPVADVLLDRQWNWFLGCLYATLRVAVNLPTIHRHARLTGRPGPHFLEGPSSPG